MNSDSIEILKAIDQIEADKKEKRIVPTHAMINEIVMLTGLKRETILEIANDLELKIGNTINSTFITRQKENNQ